MICLYAETHLSTFAFIFYACIWIPFLHITQTVARFFTFLLDPHRQPENSHFEENPEWELDLPVSQFQDFGLIEENRGGDNDSEEMCSICLMEFLKEDFVNKLPKSMVLRVRSSPCKMWASDPFCVNLSSVHDSN
ncbi:hypothetical protein DH2020_008883 [Rehmannia glutinosa]|uniref:Uncharacterized protein n=1 Tax=Rehmannia glutinosa TaxID=99300 RepID=A0ABR0X8G3_REHGL